jgi:hypothetical protein
MSRVLMALFLIAFLMGCSNQKKQAGPGSAPIETIQTKVTPSVTDIPQTQKSTDTPTVAPTAPTSSVAAGDPYFKENDFSGTQLELIKVINLLTKAINEENKVEYLKLFGGDPLPVNGLPGIKIKNQRIREFGDMTGKEIYIGYSQTHTDGTTQDGFFNFQKFDKQWKITMYD